jgi:predicted nucleotidyltransferase
MHQTIINQITQIEQKHQVKVLHACETGSRAWGFPSPDSDYDVRFIYMHPIDWYLSLNDRKDNINYMSDDGLLDLSGWDIKKCLRLMWKSNGALLERLQSPIVYKNENTISALLKQHAEQCFIPIGTVHHYLGLAKNSFEDVEGKAEMKLKKLFYALRATLACKWIIEKDAVPPIVFMTMVNELSFDLQLKNRIVELIELKANKKESYIHPEEIALNHFIATEIASTGQEVKGLEGRRDKKVDLDSLFVSIIRGY